MRHMNQPSTHPERCDVHEGHLAAKQQGCCLWIGNAADYPYHVSLSFLPGVAGFSAAMEAPAEAAARHCLSRLFEEAVASQSPRPVWMVSGSTTGGVPGLSYVAAGEMGMVRVGVTAEEARHYGIAQQERLLVCGENFGDESSRWLGQLHLALFIAGPASFL